MQDPARAGERVLDSSAVLLACVAGLGIAAALGGPIAYRELTTSAETVPPASCAMAVAATQRQACRRGSPTSRQGLGGTVTAGIISASGRDIGPYEDFIQLDVPINKGNSGEPTFDVDGKVMGVNTAIYSPSGGSVDIGLNKSETSSTRTSGS
jgi:hypothetical protein